MITNNKRIRNNFAPLRRPLRSVNEGGVASTLRLLETTTQRYLWPHRDLSQKLDKKKFNSMIIILIGMSDVILIEMYLKLKTIPDLMNSNYKKPLPQIILIIKS